MRWLFGFSSCVVDVRIDSCLVDIFFMVCVDWCYFRFGLWCSVFKLLYGVLISM